MSAESPSSFYDYHACQRAAFAEFLALSQAAVQPLEDRIAATHQADGARLQSEFDAALQALNARYQRILSAAEQEREQQARLIGVAHDTELDKLQTSVRVARDQLRGELATIEQEARRRFKDAVWEADTILRSTRRGLRSELQQEERRITTAAQGPVEWGRALDDYVRRYRVVAPREVEGDAGDGTPRETYERCTVEAADLMGQLRGLILPRWFRGWRPALLLVGSSAMVAGAAVVLRHFGVWTAGTLLANGAVFGLTAAGVQALLWRPLQRRGARRATALATAIRVTLATASRALDQQLGQARRAHRAAEARARREREQDVAKARRAYESVVGRAAQAHESTVRRIADTSDELHGRLSSTRQEHLDELEQRLGACAPAARAEYQREHAELLARHAAALQACTATAESDLAAARRRWQSGLERLEAWIVADRQLADGVADWRDAAWRPPLAFCPVVPFGTWQIDFDRLAPTVRALAPFDVTGGSRPAPAVLALPDRGSMLLQTGAEGRPIAIETLKTVMNRLLTVLPPGRVRFTIIDPVGLGENFAGFMHLADYEEALVGGRIWSERAHIEQRLNALTEHMETVIQQFLRNEFATIDEYNRQAGVLAEPYRFLVIANFPINFSDEAGRRLHSIISSGPRCGVHTLIAQDLRHPLPAGLSAEDLESAGLRLQLDGSHFMARDAIFGQFSLTVEPPPDDRTLTRLMHAVGEASRDALRVEVPFERIAPHPKAIWERESSKLLRVPIGLSGATRQQELVLGPGVAQHMLIAGKTGSGKSTLLHVLITNLALWYAPDEVEFYLVDFKKGVEFKTYATHGLPHARVIAIESDREFGISVLQRLDEELRVRGNLFRAAGVQDLAAYRAASGVTLPRTLLIVDEFQVLFAEDDRLAQDAAILLDRLVRQGRAFGIHVILGSQTLGGTSRLPRSTMGQMAVRVALQCSENDSLLILDDANPAARQLSRPGEGIYNDAGGLIEGNHTFQTAWLPDRTREGLLGQLRERATEAAAPRPVVVFEGNVPADPAGNPALQAVLAAPYVTDGQPLRVWLGEPVAITGPTQVTLRRQTGSNLLMVGQRDEVAMALSTVAVVGLAAQRAPDALRFVVLDGSVDDAAWHGDIGRCGARLPHDVVVGSDPDPTAVLAEVAAEVARRQDHLPGAAPSIVVVVHGLQRWRALRRRDDDFGFGRGGGESTSADQLLATVVREGPSLGVHVLLWADTWATCERSFDRGTLAEFDHRVLFQMSAADSSNLIDTPVANRLGFHRALLYGAEQGHVEKFRPFARPDDAWLERATAALQPAPR